MWKWCLHNFTIFLLALRNLLGFNLFVNKFRLNTLLIAFHNRFTTMSKKIFISTQQLLYAIYTKLKRSKAASWNFRLGKRLFLSHFFVPHTQPTRREMGRSRSWIICDIFFSAANKLKGDTEQRHKEKTRKWRQDENNDASRSKGNLFAWWMSDWESLWLLLNDNEKANFCLTLVWLRQNKQEANLWTAAKGVIAVNLSAMLSIEWRNCAWLEKFWLITPFYVNIY